MVNSEIKKRKMGGFVTMVEAVIVSTILVLIISSITLLQSRFITFNRQAQVSLKNNDEARRILKPFADEVRSAVSSENGSFAIASSTDTSFAFFDDYDNDGKVERVRYFLDDNTNSFRKGTINPLGTPYQYLEENEQTNEVVYDVVSTSSIFSYYGVDENGGTTTVLLSEPISPLQIRLIKVTLLIDTDPNLPPLPQTVTTQAHIRNFRDNL